MTSIKHLSTIGGATVRFRADSLMENQYGECLTYNTRATAECYGSVGVWQLRTGSVLTQKCGDSQLLFGANTASVSAERILLICLKSKDR